MIHNEHIEEFVKQAHRVGDAGLTVCSSGNLYWFPVQVHGCLL